MAEPWTSPADRDQEEAGLRPFSRDVLKATLADALRDAETSTPAPGAEVHRGPHGTDPRAGAVLHGDPGVPGDTAGEDSTPAGTAADPAAAEAPPGAETRGPMKLPKLQPPGLASSQEAPRPAPRPSLLSSGLSTPASPFSTPAVGRLTPAPGSTGMGLPPGLRRPDAPGTPASPSPKPLAGLGQSGEGGIGRLVSGLSPVPPAAPAPPADQPTIALRRPQRPQRQAEAAAGEESPEAEPAAQGLPKGSVPVEAWSPSDDDILPKGMIKRRSFLRRR